MKWLTELGYWVAGLVIWGIIFFVAWDSITAPFRKRGPKDRSPPGRPANSRAIYDADGYLTGYVDKD